MAIKRHQGTGTFSATALAKVLSGQFGELHFAVGRPMYVPATNTMYLPGIPGDDIPEDALRLLRAYLAHEAAERGRSKWNPRDPRWATRPGLKALVNGINDARIDLDYKDTYPGAYLNIRWAVQRDMERLFAENRKKPRKPSVNLIAVLARYIGEGLMTYDDAAREFPQLQKHLVKVEPELRSLDLSTEPKVIRQAIRIYKKLKSDAPPPPPPQPEPKPQPKKPEKPQPDQKQQPEPQESDEREDGPKNDTEEPKSDSQFENQAESEHADEKGEQGKPQDAEDGEPGEDPDESLDNDGPEDDSPLDETDESEGGAGADAEETDEDGDDIEADAEGGGDGDESDDIEDDADDIEDDADGDTGDADAEGSDADAEAGEGGLDADGLGDADGNDLDEFDSPGPKSKKQPIADEAATDHDTQSEMLKDLVKEMFGGDGEDEDTMDGLNHTYTFDASGDVVVTAQQARATDAKLRMKRLARPIQVLETKLRQALTIAAPSMVRHQEKGELDEGSIHRLVAGRSNVFRRRVIQESDSVAVSLSIDESSSMDGSRIETSIDLALTFNAALGRLKFPTEVLGWTTGGHGVPSDTVYRQDSVRHTIYKAFTDQATDEKVIRRIANAKSSGTTPTAEGLMFALERLGRRTERRRVLFFLTDGRPVMEATGPKDVHHEFIHTLLRRAAAAGIEVYGIGISADLSEWFPPHRWLPIDKIDELPMKAGEQLVRVLREGKRELLRG